MATNVHLTPELEAFARACVASGRFNNVSEVMRAGLRLLEAAEGRRLAFARMLDEARAEAESEGWSGIDEVAAELDAIIEGVRERR